MDGTKAPLGSWDGIIKDEQYGDRKLIDMDNRSICNFNYCRTRAKCWMKQIFCTKWCLNEKVSSTKISPGLDGWRTYRNAVGPEIVPEKKSVQVHFQLTLNRDAVGPEIVPEKKSGCPTSLFVEGIRIGEQQKQNKEGNMGAIEDDENSTNDDIKVVRSFKFVLVEHIRDLLKPYRKHGNLSRDAYKIIMKKSVDKIIESIGASKVPKTENERTETSQPKKQRSLSSYRYLLAKNCPEASNTL